MDSTGLLKDNICQMPEDHLEVQVEDAPLVGAAHRARDGGLPVVLG